MHNVLLLLLEACLYFGVMAVFFRLRDRIGLGVFVCALGAMHFLETYLASVFYVTLPFGIVSPGSSVLFSGKLAMLLLLYIKEDAAKVRQPIYGLLLGNALMIALVFVLTQHEIAPLPNGQRPDIGFIDQMGWLMVWGTSLLFFDAILMILLYERLGRYLRSKPFLRILTALSCVLTFDQAGFYAALHFFSDAPVEVFLGGWFAKMGAALTYSAMLCAYMRWFERNEASIPRGLADIFQILTYRERYEALAEHIGRDGLTGLLHRGRFETDGQHQLRIAQSEGNSLSLLLLDVDHFKSVNDRFGHAEGDRVLRSVATLLLQQTAGREGLVYRIGGEEFAILCPHPHAVACLLGERIRAAIKASLRGKDFEITISAGVASSSDETPDVDALFALADRRLYLAKAGGRDRVVGIAQDKESGPLASWEGPLFT